MDIYAGGGTLRSFLLCSVGECFTGYKIAYELFRIDVSDTASRLMLAGVLLSALFLGEGNEAVSLGSILSLLLVSLGIFLVNYQFEKKS